MCTMYDKYESKDKDKWMHKVKTLTHIYSDLEKSYSTLPLTQWRISYGCAVYKYKWKGGLLQTLLLASPS